MSLNGSLAGLVAITAGCDTVSPTSAAIIGIISGFVVVFGIEFIDKVLKVDDPVGAVGVHGLNGAFGTLAVGLFSDGTGTMERSSVGGVVSCSVYRYDHYNRMGCCNMTIIFQAIKHTVGLRVTAEEEIEGLDSKEHGLTSAYDGFVVHDTMTVPTPMGVAKKSVSSNTSANVAPAEVVDTIPDLPREGVHKLTKVVIITRQSKLEEFMHNERNRCYWYHYYKCYGMGVKKGARSYYRGVEMDMNLLPKIKIEIVVSLVPVKTVIDTAKKVLHTGQLVTASIRMISKMLLRSVPVKKDSKHFRTHSLLNDFSVKNILIPLFSTKKQLFN
ncbi:MAG: ammonium transporter [Eubacterium ramulus]